MNGNKRSEHRKTDRRWTQIYADKMEFLRLPQRVLASFKPVAKSHRLGPTSCHNQRVGVKRSTGKNFRLDRDLSRVYLRQSAFICGSALFAFHSCTFAVNFFSLL